MLKDKRLQTNKRANKKKEAAAGRRSKKSEKGIKVGAKIWISTAVPNQAMSRVKNVTGIRFFREEESGPR